MARFKDIKKLTQDSHYRVDVPWDYLQSWIDRQKENGLNLHPDFQRGHVWTEDQQVAYIEHTLRGGVGSNELRFNHPGWMSNWEGEMVIVDGLQRLTAILAFINDEIKAFGHYHKDYEDKRYLASISMSVRVNNLKTRAQVLDWYIEINDGGTPHTTEEIERVKKLRDSEK